MVDLYYNNDTTDGQWDTIGNWWLDLAYTLPAATYGLPQAGDNVFIDNKLSAGPVVPVALNAIECGFYNSSSSFNVNLGGATTTTYNFYNNVTHTGTTVVGSYNFRDNSTNSGTVVGPYYFRDNSTNSGTVDSNNMSSGFFDNSQNTGSAANAAGFSGSAANSGTCGSDASFSYNSLNSGTVVGNATFNDNSYNSGTVVGNATFNTFTDLGDGEYEDTVGYGIGTVNGDVAGSGSQFYILKYLNNEMIGSIIATTDQFTVEFRNSTFNTGVIDLYDEARVSYYDNSYNTGTVSGDADFFNFSYNIGTVSGDVTFSDSSYNSGTVSGDATFNYLTVTDGIVDDTTGYSSGIVGGVVYGASSTVITTWRFSGDLRNAATCDGDAIFNGDDDFGNSGTITGDASFYNGSFNSGTVQGTTFIYDGSRNTGTVEDIVYKSAEAARLAIQNSYIGTINGTVSLPFADILGTGLQ